MSDNSFKVEAGRTISHFRLEKLLGEGGMGDVFLAEDLTLSREVAIKFMRRSMLASLPNAHQRENIEQRFIREAKSAARINHPNIAQIYEADFETDNWYIAMEFINGSPLDEILKAEGRFSIKKALSVLQQVVAGLNFAWENYKIIHRDIKPQNLMLTKEGFCKIVDLGLAKPIIENSEEELELTGAGVPVGTPYYMAPEQAIGGDVDFRADIFALGASIYELLSASKAFKGKTPPMIYNKMITKDYKPLTDFGIEPAISSLVDKMLEPDPRNRIATYNQLLKEIEACGGAGINSMASTLIDENQETQLDPSFGSVVTGGLGEDMATMIDVFLPVDYKIMDRYRILKVVGQGNSGIVYHCLDTHLERECSVKNIASGREYGPEIFPQIKKNYKKLSARKHANLVEIFDIHEMDDGREIFIVMEWLQGQNLLEYANSMSHIKERIEIEDVAPMLMKVASAIDSVTQKFSMVHNDLKPVSLFMCKDGEVKILDYGVTYRVRESDPHAHEKEIWRHPIANPDYMSPELWKHEKPTMFSDQYSFAVIVYELLSHKLPFWLKGLQVGDGSNQDMFELFQKQYDRVLNVVPETVSYLSKSQNKSLLKALSKQPEKRYPSCLDFIRDLSGSQNKNKLIISLIAAAAILVFGAVLFQNAEKEKLESAFAAQKLQYEELLTKYDGLPENQQFRNKFTEIEAEATSKGVAEASESLKVALDALAENYKTSSDALKNKFRANETILVERLELIVKRSSQSQGPSLARLELPTFNESSLSAMEASVKHSEELLGQSSQQLKKLSEYEEEFIAGLKIKIKEYEQKWAVLSSEDSLRSSIAEFKKVIETAVLYVDDKKYELVEKKLAQLAELHQQSLKKVRQSYESKLAKVNNELAGLNAEIEPVLYFLEDGSTKYRQLLALNGTAESKLKAGEFKEALRLKNSQLKQLLEFKTMLTTSAKESYLSQVRKSSRACLELLQEIEPMKQYLKNSESFSQKYSSAQKLFVKKAYETAKKEFESLKIELSQAHNDLQAVLKNKVNQLHEQAVDLMARLEDDKEINPDVALEVDDLSVQFRLARASKSERKYGLAFEAYTKLTSELANLKQRVDVLKLATPGKDWQIPGLNIAFVWVKSMKMWVAKYEVTNGEFRKFKPEFKNNIFQGVGSLNGDRQPVSLVSYLQAEAFCKWLTIRSREKQQLPQGYAFRLPTAAEWKRYASSGNLSFFPWGDEWPPKQGNYGDDRLDPNNKPEWKDYKDGVLLTAPVEKSGMNKWGLYGCSGNVWEWTSDAEGDNRAVFGGSWNSIKKLEMQTSPVGNYAPKTLSADNIGFRIVLAPQGR